MAIRAGLLFKRNVETLLKSRGCDYQDLAFSCQKSPSWISKLLSDTTNPLGEKGVPLKDLHCIASFFGLEVYQLFQPGLAGEMTLERRSRLDRRSGKDRRKSKAIAPPDAIRAADLALTRRDVAVVMKLVALGDGEEREKVERAVQLAYDRLLKRRTRTKGASRDPQEGSGGSGEPS